MPRDWERWIFDQTSLRPAPPNHGSEQGAQSPVNSLNTIIKELYQKLTRYIEEMLEETTSDSEFLSVYQVVRQGASQRQCPLRYPVWGFLSDEEVLQFVRACVAGGLTIHNDATQSAAQDGKDRGKVLKRDVGASR